MNEARGQNNNRMMFCLPEIKWFDNNRVMLLIEHPLHFIYRDDITFDDGVSVEYVAKKISEGFARIASAAAINQPTHREGADFGDYGADRVRGGGSKGLRTRKDDKHVRST